jgi:hypothetical protein
MEDSIKSRANTIAVVKNRCFLAYFALLVTVIDVKRYLLVNVKRKRRSCVMKAMYDEQVSK